jgi:WD40 repeat protein
MALSRITTLMLAGLILAGCGGGGAKTESSPTPAETPTPAATPTPLPPTWTPAPTFTKAPRPTYVITPRPTATQFVPPTRTPVFVPTTITAQNVEQLSEVGSVNRSIAADLAWSPDGKTLAVAATDGIWLYNDANFYSLSRQFVIPGDELGQQAECVAFSPDGTTLAAGNGDGLLRLWDVAGGTVRTSWTVGDNVSISDCAYTSDGAMLVTTGSPHHLAAWDPATGELIRAFDTASYDGYSLAIYPLNAPVIVAGGSDPKPEVWNLDQDTPLAVPAGHTANARAAAFSPDGKTFATGGGDGSVRLWTVAGAQNDQPLVVLEGPAGQVYSLAYSPDSALLAAGYGDGELVIWDLTTHAQVFSTEAHLLWVEKVVWSPDGTRLISAGSDAVRVWGVRSGETSQ